MSQNGHAQGGLTVTADEESVTVTKSKGGEDHVARIRRFSEAEIESFAAQLAQIYAHEEKATLMERIVEFMRTRTRTA